MRFMIMHKMTDELERGEPPDPEVVAGVNRLVAEAVKDRTFIAGEGLKPSSQRTRIVYRGGKRTMTDGPFAETKELIGGFALMRVRSKEEAIAWCDRFAAVTGDVELILGPVVEPWDLGLMPAPKKAPLRFLSVVLMTRDDDTPPDPAHIERLNALIEEATSTGALQMTDGLKSTKHGARIHYQGGRHTVVDGPFAESKELVAGFAMLELPSKAAAIEWALRFGEVVKVNEIEVREMA